MYLKICLLFILFQAFEVSSEIARLKKDYNVSACKFNERNITMPSFIAYTNWPFQLSCNVMLPNVNINTGQCFISSSQSFDILYNRSIIINESSSSRNIFTVVQHYNASFCIATNVSVEVKSLPSRSCFDDVIYTLNNDVNIQNVSLTIRDDIDWSCTPAPNAGSDVILPPNIPSDQFTVRWRVTRLNKTLEPIKDEETCMDVNSRFILSPPDSPPTLSNLRVDFRDPGIYTCEVEYDGQVAYISHYSLCVKNKLVQQHDLSVSCNSNERLVYSEGDDVKITCNVHTGNEKISPSQIKVDWSKASHGGICYNDDYTEVNHSIDDPRLSCGVNDVPNQGIKCFSYLATSDELSNYQDNKVFKIVLNIKNAMASDEGTYEVRLWFVDRWSETQSIKLSLDPSEYLRTVITILVAIVITLILATSICFIIWYRRFTILLKFRRHFGKYDEDDKLYVVNFCYYLSGNDKDETDENTKSILRLIRETLNNLKYKFYDSNEDYEAGNVVENMLAMVEKSHRMVVVLTDAFIRDDFSRFKAFEGRHSMLKNKTKLIVISTPGAMEALKECVSNGISFARDFQEIIKVSRCIKWKKNINATQFKEQMEYALPNLKKKDESQQPFVSNNCL